jgi:hypothetical protein
MTSVPFDGGIAMMVDDALDLLNGSQSSGESMRIYIALDAPGSPAHNPPSRSEVPPLPQSTRFTYLY